MIAKDIEDCRAAIAALEGQRATLGDAVVELATAPLRARLAGLLRPAGLQHRQVTVLFADVVGSTAMAQGLDAEDTLDVLSGALQRMAALVDAHQGRVLRFTGDGVKAAFGMNEAREDDAERAVRAGLAMLAAGRELAEAAMRLHGITDFAVRVGVHTGDVALGAGVEADNTAMGAAVHIAARMEQSAPPGALRISHDTWSLVRGLFELEPQPLLVVKGIEAPMQTYLVRTALERSVASVERGLQGMAMPMVGRDAELRRLLDAVARARDTRQMQELTLVGDAGLGKSRLLRDLMAALTDCRVLALRAQPDGMLRLWGLLRSLLATQFGVADTDSAEVARRKVVDGLSPWFDARGEQQAQLIGQLAGLDFGDSPHLRGLDPRSLRDQAFAALRAYLQALAAKGGALPVLLVEDLHWVDDSSLDLLQHLRAHADALPLMLVMTGRPTLLERRPDWGTPGTMIQLSPLSVANSRELAQTLLRRVDVVPPKLTVLVVGRAEGNPYYMEELVRKLIDDGVIVVGEPHWKVYAERLDTIRLPGTLVGLLQSRLDALPASERHAARQASIIGHVFWDDALQALDPQAPQALPALRRAAFVHAHDSSDFEGTPERQFDHHLLHQVTYDTLLKAERRLGHGAVAHWLRERTQGRGAEFLAMTGDHAERAGETALAVDCFEQAGKAASKRYANTAANSWLRRALALLGESEPLRRLDLLDILVGLADTVGDRSGQQALHAQAAALLERYPDDSRLARLWFSMGLLADRIGDVAAAERLSRQAFELSERCGAAWTAAMSQGQLAWLQYTRREYADAGKRLEIGLQWAAKVEDEVMRAEIESQLLVVSAVVSTDLCRLDEARESLLAVLSRGEAQGQSRLQLSALDGLVNIAATLGRWDEVSARAERMITVAQTIGAVPRMAHAHQHAALAAQARGEHVAAMRLHELALPALRANGDRRTEVASLYGLGMLHQEQGDDQTALQWFAQAQAMFEALEDHIGACEAAASSALSELRLGQSSSALSKVNQLLERLSGDLVERPAHETIGLRWLCQQVLDAVADSRAAPMLEQLFADVHARATQLTSVVDRDRLIQAQPIFRAIVAEHRRHGGPGAAG